MGKKQPSLVLGKNEIRPPPYTMHRINLKWIEDLNVSK